MSFKFTAAHGSRIKKSTNPGLRRSASSSPFATLPRRKPIQRSKTQLGEDEEDEFGDRLEDRGLVRTLATDLSLRDVAQAVMYIRGKMWSSIPQERSGMNSSQTAEVLKFRASLPAVVTVSHVQALLNSATTVEREIAQLIRGGVLRKIVVGGRGSMGEILILVKDLEAMVHNSIMESEVRDRFLDMLRKDPTALTISRSSLRADDAKAIMQAGFITASMPTWTSTQVFSAPGEASRGTATSLNSISRAASGSMAAVGGQGAVHAAGGTGGGISSHSAENLSLSIPAAGSFMKLVGAARVHLVSLLSKSKFKEAPQTLLRQRWDGGIAAGDVASLARRTRGEFDGVLPGRTRKWKTYYGVGFDWILAECVGAGLLEVFETGSVGRGVRAL